APHTTGHVYSSFAGSCLRRHPDNRPSNRAHEYPLRKTSNVFPVHPTALEISSSALSSKDEERTSGSPFRSAPCIVQNCVCLRSALSRCPWSPAQAVLSHSLVPEDALPPPAPPHNKNG